MTNPQCLSQVPQFSRRQFGKLVGAAGLALGASPGWRSRPPGPRTPRTSAAIIEGKVSGLLDPQRQARRDGDAARRCCASTSTRRRRSCSAASTSRTRATPAWYATTAAPDRPDWTIRIDGLVRAAARVKLSDLAGDGRRRSASRCCNAPATAAATTPPRRRSPAASGRTAAWATSNGRACRSAQFLEDQKALPSPDANWLTAEGWDQPATPEGSDFAKSYHLDDTALDHAILALKMNGEPIPAATAGRCG